MAEPQIKMKKAKKEQVVTPVKIEAVVEMKPSSGISPVSIALDKNLLEVNPQNAFQGIIWAEILGKPKSMRKGRW